MVEVVVADGDDVDGREVLEGDAGRREARDDARDAVGPDRVGRDELTAEAEDEGGVADPGERRGGGGGGGALEEGSVVEADGRRVFVAGGIAEAAAGEGVDDAPAEDVGEA